MTRQVREDSDGRVPAWSRDTFDPWRWKAIVVEASRTLDGDGDPVLTSHSLQLQLVSRHDRLIAEGMSPEDAAKAVRTSTGNCARLLDPSVPKGRKTVVLPTYDEAYAVYQALNVHDHFLDVNVLARVRARLGGHELVPLAPPTPYIPAHAFEAVDRLNAWLRAHADGSTRAEKDVLWRQLDTLLRGIRAADQADGGGA
jgi:hypothetical protein